MIDRQSTADIDLAAARWALRLDRNDLTDADRAEHAAWLASDVRCRGALLQAEAAWLALDVLRDDTGGSPDAADPGPDDLAVRRRVLSRRTMLAGLGSAAAASVAAVFLAGQRPDRYDTAIGEVRRVPLADRSTMAINTDSRIGVAYAKARRSISIERGEAWFQVAHDRTRPFVVSAGRVRVEAVGTAFSVRRRADGADVMVTEGVVRVWVDGNEAGAIRLGAGSALLVSDENGSRPKPVLAPAIDRKLAWRSGQMDIAGETLGEAVEEFNRYSPTPIVVLDRAVADKRLYGVFRLDDPQGFARTAAVALGVAAWRQDDRIFIATQRH